MTRSHDEVRAELQRVLTELNGTSPDHLRIVSRALGEAAEGCTADGGRCRACRVQALCAELIEAIACAAELREAVRVRGVPGTRPS